jgi:hypothetical protein
MQNDPEARLTHVAIVQGEPGVVTSDFIKPFLHIDRTAPQLLPEFRGVLDRAETTHKYLGTPAAAEEWERSHDFSVDDDEMHEPDISDTECIDSNTEHQSINQTAQGQQFRPPLPQTPPIWAQVGLAGVPPCIFYTQDSFQSRQELCESFDWFRSYQGGVYFTNNVAKGYLLSAFASR